MATRPFVFDTFGKEHEDTVAVMGTSCGLSSTVHYLQYYSQREKKEEKPENPPTKQCIDGGRPKRGKQKKAGSTLRSSPGGPPPWY